MPPVVKICGLRSVEAALKAMDSGADMLGVIMVPNRKRTISHDVAKKIAENARIRRKRETKMKRRKGWVSVQSGKRHKQTKRNNGRKLEISVDNPTY
jgi:phosphoribosylanthranilate isomerase